MLMLRGMKARLHVLFLIFVAYSTSAAYESNRAIQGETLRSLQVNEPDAMLEAPSLPSSATPTSPPSDLRVAITGGAGQIAYALLPLVIHGKVFGQARRVQLRLLDIPACVTAMEGIAMEIRDCYPDLVTEVIVTADPKVAFRDADVAILLGGFPRQPGMERRELIARNVPIMAEHGQALSSCAKKAVRVLVVANPACTNCLVVSAFARTIPRCQFSSLSRLDHDRLLAMIGAELSSVRPEGAGDPDGAPDGLRRGRRARPSASPNIRGACLWGNHSPSMWPDLSKAEALTEGGWVPIELLIGARVTGAADVSHGGSDWGDDRRDVLAAVGRQWISTKLVPDLRSRGTRVMKARGKSSAMSAANAISNHLQDWLSPPSEPCKAASERQGANHGNAKVPRCVSMGVSTDGNAYGVPEGLFFSFPVECSAGRHRILDGFSPDYEMMSASTQELVDERREAIEVLEELGFEDYDL